MAVRNLLAPKIQENERIADWRVIFEATIEELRTLDNGSNACFKFTYIDKSLSFRLSTGAGCYHFCGQSETGLSHDFRNA